MPSPGRREGRWCCIRPMRRNDNCCPTPPERTTQSVEEEIHRTRGERDLVRAQSAEPASPQPYPVRDGDYPTVTLRTNSLNPFQPRKARHG